MPADVEEGADGVVVVADDDQVLAAELGQEILAGQLDLLFAPDEDPAFGEPLLELVSEDVGVVIDARRQEGRALGRLARGGDLGRGDGRGAGSVGLRMQIGHGLVAPGNW